MSQKCTGRTLFRALAQKVLDLSEPNVAYYLRGIFVIILNVPVTFFLNVPVIFLHVPATPQTLCTLDCMYSLKWNPILQTI